MVAQCCYHGQSPPITTNHPPITSEIHDQSPSNHFKIVSTGTTNHRSVTSTGHETFPLCSIFLFLLPLTLSALFYLFPYSLCLLFFWFKYTLSVSLPFVLSYFLYNCISLCLCSSVFLSISLSLSLSLSPWSSLDYFLHRWLRFSYISWCRWQYSDILSQKSHDAVGSIQISISG